MSVTIEDMAQICADVCNENMNVPCPYRKLIANDCPLHKGCRFVQAKDWLDALKKPEPSSLPTKIMFVKLVDDNKRELCAGAYFSYDDPGVENFDEAEKACWSSLYENIRRKSLFHVNKTYTDKEIEAAISLLIDYAHYSIEWGYMGWAR